MSEQVRALAAVRAARSNRETARVRLMEAIRLAHAAGVPVARIVREAGISRAAFYVWLDSGELVLD